ncbi:MAG: 4Fe-4S binding protein [Promethearchaeota archaeon]
MTREYFRPIQIEIGLCVHCERCERNCPNQAIHFNGEQRLIDYKKCRGCLTCVNVCPRNAISVTSVEKDEVISVDVIFDKCLGCGDCAEICPNKLYEKYSYKPNEIAEKSVYRVPPSRFSECSGCELCVENCPEGIITIQRFLPKD